MLLFQTIDQAADGGPVDLGLVREFCLGQGVLLPEKRQETELLGGQIVAVKLFLEEGVTPLVNLCQQKSHALFDVEHEWSFLVKARIGIMHIISILSISKIEWGKLFSHQGQLEADPNVIV